MDDSMNIQSSRGAFGWTTIDNVNIPKLYRDSKEYVAVKMVEQKLLAKYPSTYPPELSRRAPLVSHHVSQKEAQLLNEINIEHCAMEYGPKKFTVDDLIVKLSDFKLFYDIVKKHFPNVNVVKGIPKASSQKPNQSTQETPVRCAKQGWFQVNSTAVPFVSRSGQPLIPLSVIRYGACLLNDKRVFGYLPTNQEVTTLNSLCEQAAVEFTFTRAHKLISVDVLKEFAGESLNNLVLLHESDENETGISKPVLQKEAVASSNSIPNHSPLGTNSTHSLPQQLSLINVKNQQGHSGRQIQPWQMQMMNGRVHPQPEQSSLPMSVSKRKHSDSRMVGNVVVHDDMTYPTPPTSQSPNEIQRTTAQIIESVHFNGQKMSCIRKGDDNRPYVLVEAVCRVFFRNFNLEHFLFLLQKIVQVPIQNLTPGEESLFIQFYNLPTTNLKCNQVIKLQDLERSFPSIVEHVKRANATTHLNNSQSKKKENRIETNQQGYVSGSYSYLFSKGLSNANLVSQVKRQDNVSPSKKRLAPSDSCESDLSTQSSLPKQNRISSLENTVQRLIRAHGNSNIQQ